MSMLSLILSGILLLKFAWLALIQTVFGILDHTHFYVDAVKVQVVVLWKIIRNYCVAAPCLFWAHFNHNVYLNKLGLDGVDNLKDNGTLVMMKQLARPNAKAGSTTVPKVTGFQNNSSGNADHMALSSSAILKLWSVLREMPDFRFPETAFLDFGCGTGFALISAMTQPFHCVVGVETDGETVQLAENNIMSFRMSHARAVPIRCNAESVLQMNMTDFTYSTLPEETNTVVLYMYEPLWTVPKSVAHDIYLTVLSRAREYTTTGNKRVIVAYFHAGWFNGDALPALQEIDAQLLTSFDFDSLHFGSYSTCYVYDL